ncbi:MAG: ADP-ribosylglycohydrolase family protein [Clostridia bacterium]
MEQFSRDYPERVYAGWLGKMIGIRLGAPIESMPFQKIRDIFGHIQGYLIDYDLFAADDDSNGPLFFVRALEDGGNGDSMIAQDVAAALLNYVPYEHGFFWWGGYGISTEHTAYLNLHSGMAALESGSAETNGIVAAEQIGGQIFSDCWGLVCPNNPKLAARLAGTASHVTHDGNAVFGGMFIAACISLAFSENDIPSIIDRALEVIPQHCEYHRVAQHVIAFHDAHPDDWERCFQDIESNFGYDKYPGACHVIPNAAVILLSLLYGAGNFDRSLCISCMCGWDTDCNAGNVGTILGVLNGIDQIDFVRWRKPINDFLACSSVLGCLNLTDVSTSASYMARQGYQLAGQQIPAQWEHALTHAGDCLFAYPGATQALRTRVHAHAKFAYRAETFLSNVDEATATCRRALKIYACHVTRGQLVDVYKRTYLHQSDFQDSRYDPAFSPILYPGERIEGRVCVPDYAQTCAVRMYVGLRGGEIIEGEPVVLMPGKWESLSMQVPAGNMLIEEAGFRFIVDGPDTDKAELCVLIDSLVFSGKPRYSVCAANETEEYWRPTHREITQFTRLHGTSELKNGFLYLKGEHGAEVYTGKLSWKDYSATGHIRPIKGKQHLLLFRVQGAIRSYAFGFSGTGQVALMKKTSAYQTLAASQFDWAYGKEYRVCAEARGGKIVCSINDIMLVTYVDETTPYLNGAVGFFVSDEAECAISQLDVTG